MTDEALKNLATEIVDQFDDGQLIPHKWLRKRCGIEQLRYEDYENQYDFIEALQMQQFQYMSVCTELRTILLEDFNCYFKNDRGDGYVILDPQHQTEFGYDRFQDKLRKLMKETNLIMNNVRAVNKEQQAKDNDLRAKYAAMKMMLESMKR